MNGNGNAKLSMRSTTDSAPPRLDRVEQVGHDLADAAFQAFDPSHRERGRHQSPQARVIGRIDREHVAGERGPGQAFGDDTS